MLPLLKDNHYAEEKELRLVFRKTPDDLGECVRRYDAGDDVKSPYVAVKFGDIGRNNDKCKFNLSLYTDEFVKRLSEQNVDLPIWIEEGRDQEALFNELMRRINKNIPGYEKMTNKPFKIYCKGHMPISKIIVSPMENADRRMEMIKHRCNEKYWLRNVEVCVSKIPYRKSVNKK